MPISGEFDAIRVPFLFCVSYRMQTDHDRFDGNRLAEILLIRFLICQRVARSVCVSLDACVHALARARTQACTRSRARAHSRACVAARALQTRSDWTQSADNDGCVIA